MRRFSHFFTIFLVVFLLSLSIFGNPARANHSSFTLGDVVYSQYRWIAENNYRPGALPWHHPDGSFNRTLSSAPENGHFYEGLTFDTLGNFYVVTVILSTGNKYIQKYDPNGNPAGTFAINLMSGHFS